MKKSRYSDSQIMIILKQGEAGTPNGCIGFIESWSLIYG